MFKRIIYLIFSASKIWKYVIMVIRLTHIKKESVKSRLLPFHASGQTTNMPALSRNVTYIADS